MRAVRFLAAMLWLLATGTVSAVEPMSCRNGFFPERMDVISAGRIIDSAGPRVHLYNDDDGCPEAATCRQKAYLVPGDEVLVAQRDGAWVCVWYFGKRREYVGWLPAGTVAFAPKTPPALEDWVGIWQPIGGGNEIVIRRDPAGKWLSAEGTALWLGVELPDGSRNVHTGEFSGSGCPAGDRWRIGDSGEEGLAEEYDCVVDLRLVDGRLVVHDNTHCGGMNVRFDDIYRKAGPAPASQPNGR